MVISHPVSFCGRYNMAPPPHVAGARRMLDRALRLSRGMPTVRLSTNCLRVKGVAPGTQTAAPMESRAAADIFTSYGCDHIAPCSS